MTSWKERARCTAQRSYGPQGESSYPSSRPLGSLTIPHFSDTWLLEPVPLPENSPAGFLQVTDGMCRSDRAAWVPVVCTLISSMCTRKSNCRFGFCVDDRSRAHKIYFFPSRHRRSHTNERSRQTRKLACRLPANTTLRRAATTPRWERPSTRLAMRIGHSGISNCRLKPIRKFFRQLARFIWKRPVGIRPGKLSSNASNCNRMRPRRGIISEELRSAWVTCARLCKIIRRRWNYVLQWCLR